MALPTEDTRRLAETIIEQWIKNEAFFSDLDVVYLLEFEKKAACVPSGQEDAEQPRGGSIEHVRDGYFEKRIGRIAGGPPPRGKPKLSSKDATIDPIAGIESTAAVHRAIVIAEKQR
jgi:hypothetical protein